VWPDNQNLGRQNSTYVCHLNPNGFYFKHIISYYVDHRNWVKYNFLGFAQKRKLTNSHHDPSDLWGTIRFSLTRNPWLNRLFIPDYWWLNAHVSLFDPELKINPYPHCWLYLIMYPQKIVGLYHHCCLLHPHVLKQSHPKCFRGKYSKFYANIHKFNAKNVQFWWIDRS
jgi:hypothetical protein